MKCPSKGVSVSSFRVNVTGCCRFQGKVVGHITLLLQHHANKRLGLMVWTESEVHLFNGYPEIYT